MTLHLNIEHCMYSVQERLRNGKLDPYDVMPIHFTLPVRREISAAKKAGESVVFTHDKKHKIIIYGRK